MPELCPPVLGAQGSRTELGCPHLQESGGDSWVPLGTLTAQQVPVSARCDVSDQIPTPGSRPLHRPRTDICPPCRERRVHTRKTPAQESRRHTELTPGSRPVPLLCVSAANQGEGPHARSSGSRLRATSLPSRLRAVPRLYRRLETPLRSPGGTLCPFPTAVRRSRSGGRGAERNSSDVDVFPHLAVLSQGAATRPSPCQPPLLLSRTFSVRPPTTPAPLPHLQATSPHHSLPLPCSSFPSFSPLHDHHLTISFKK